MTRTLHGAKDRTSLKYITAHSTPIHVADCTARKNEYRGKNILITGASSGIGAALAQLFIAGGATVYNLDKMDAIAPDQFASRRQSVSPNLHFVRCDLCNPASINSAAATLTSHKLRKIRIDIFVSNAGIMTRGDVLSVTTRDAATSYAVFVEGPRLLLKKLLDSESQQGCLSKRLRIVHISSMHASFHDKMPGIYALHKILAEEMLELSLRQQWSLITCYFGHVDTALTRKGKSARAYAAQKQGRISAEKAASLVNSCLRLHARALVYDRQSATYSIKQ